MNTHHISILIDLALEVGRLGVIALLIHMREMADAHEDHNHCDQKHGHDQKLNYGY